MSQLNHHSRHRRDKGTKNGPHIMDRVVVGAYEKAPEISERPSAFELP